MYAVYVRHSCERVVQHLFEGLVVVTDVVELFLQIREIRRRCRGQIVVAEFVLQVKQTVPLELVEVLRVGIRRHFTYVELRRTFDEERPFLFGDLRLGALDVHVDQKGKDRFVRFEDAALDVLVNVLRDLPLKKGDSRLHVRRALVPVQNGVDEDLLEVLQRKLVHRVDLTHVSNDEEQNASTVSNRHVLVTYHVRFLLNQYVLTHVHTHLVRHRLRVFQRLDQLLVVEDLLFTHLRQLLQNVTTELRKLVVHAPHVRYYLIPLLVLLPTLTLEHLR